jgi:Cu(I)/Ag(I) efflux system membrane fusion protein
MNPRLFVLALVCLAVALGGGYGLYHAGLVAGRTSSASGPGAPQKSGDIDPETGKPVLYWHDPMQPAQRFDHPGKSPFMDMQLVPVVGGAADAGTVQISPGLQQNLGVRLAEVTRGRISTPITASASIGYDEREEAVVQARATGFVEHVRVRATQDVVRQGEPLADLYVPDWIAAQTEYLAVRNLHSPGSEDLIEGARNRLRLAGMPEELIRLLDRTGKAQARFTLTSPISGVVTELSARDGMTVMSGNPLFRINALSTVWLDAQVPETLAHDVRVGDAVSARPGALRGAVFAGTVTAVLPSVDPATRTVTVRVELPNPKRQLLPGMFVSVQFASGGGPEVLIVPSEAVIETGTRRVVLVSEAEGRFRPVNVATGRADGGETEIRSGLAAGQKVVVSGQFLIDSEASLRATEGRLQ